MISKNFKLEEIKEDNENCKFYQLSSENIRLFPEPQINGNTQCMI